ncbi:MAG: hypothetical protein HDT30_01110 [Clostridiales bacterium]|nr:hypothetical protein [Clostridiales bacterium]
MGRKVSKDKRLFVANDMPPLRRTQPGKSYNYKDDEVLKWISERPGLLMYVFDKLSAGNYITYDQNSGKWQGVDYNND